MSVLSSINDAVWGVPLLILIIGVGLYLTIRTGAAQIKLFPKALRQFFKGDSKQNGTSPKRALSTALAATVGTGNLAGVAGSICIGGPGTIFWLWICGFLGMILKCAEATLAVRYRIKNKQGEFVGGPMYMIRQGMPKCMHWLAGVYCFFGVVAAFGVGNAVQVNAITGSVHTIIDSCSASLSVSVDIFVGLLLAIITYFSLSSGGNRIGKITEKMIPFAAGLYLLLGSIYLAVNHSKIIPAFESIFVGAFSPPAVTCGIVGTIFLVLRTGISRGVFTNEAGMGTASIAHASAEVDHPLQQGFMGIVEVFIDTILICTMTALIILCSDTAIPYGTDPGISLTISAFSDLYGSASGVIMTIMVSLFALATVLGWSLYGGRCAQYLFGEKSWRSFVVLQTIIVFASVLMKTETVWMLSEILNGLMAIPNLIAIVWLSPEFLRLFNEYKTHRHHL